MPRSVIGGSAARLLTRCRIVAQSIAPSLNYVLTCKSLTPTKKIACRLGFSTQLTQHTRVKIEMIPDDEQHRNTLSYPSITREANPPDRRHMPGACISATCRHQFDSGTVVGWQRNHGKRQRGLQEWCS